MVQLHKLASDHNYYKDNVWIWWLKMPLCKYKAGRGGFFDFLWYFWVLSNKSQNRIFEIDYQHFFPNR